jgi:hypothetical protein
MSTPDAMHQAYGRIYAGLQLQAQTLAFIDTFWVLALIALCIIPLVPAGPARAGKGSGTLTR